MCRPGTWLWLCRPGYEGDLVDELLTAGGGSKQKLDAQAVTQALVCSTARPMRGRTPVELAYARQGFPVRALVRGQNAEELARAIAAASGLQHEPHASFALHVFVPDSDALNPLSSVAAAVEQATLRQLRSGEERCIKASNAPSGKVPLVMACLLSPTTAAVGAIPVGQAVSLVPGGRHRMRMPERAPSRASAKLLEAFDWLGRAPEPGDVCVDLGAAPGGWSFVLLERRAHVIAVDPARLEPALLRHRHLIHVATSAFEYVPEQPVDWLLCDMAWRPLEVAALLARWGRQRRARFLLANIKLPMKKKVAYIARIKEILATGDWRDLRVRQLYHDRDEVTLGAWRLV